MNHRWHFIYKVVRIHSWVNQKRVLARDMRGRLLSIPEDYIIKFEVLSQKKKRRKFTKHIWEYLTLFQSKAIVANRSRMGRGQGMHRIIVSILNVASNYVYVLCLNIMTLPEYIQRCADYMKKFDNSTFLWETEETLGETESACMCCWTKRHLRK